MIPGPIAPRVPVDPGPQPMHKADGEPERPKKGHSFADLLEAMLAPGAAPDASAPDASAPEQPGAVFERLDAAQVFNETGLFRGAAPLTAEDVAGAGWPAASGAPARPGMPADAAFQHSLRPSPAVGGAPAEGQAGAHSAADLRLDLPGGSAPANASPKSREGALAVRASPGQPVAALQTPGRTPEAAGRSAAVGRRSETSAMLIQAYLAKGGSAAAQVSVQAVEGGISLVARADKLSREEMDKLRIEIGELLARHGLSAAEIMLNGEAGPSLKGRDE